MPKIITYEFVKESFEKEGYELLSKEYVGAHYKLGYICPKGHRGSISWGNWQQKRRCLYCAGKIKKTVEFIRLELAKENYKLLTTEYENCDQKLEYICSNGHNCSIRWHDWQRGVRCPYCVGLGKPTIEFIISEFAKENYILLTKKYINSKQKLDYICPNGHKHNIIWGDWRGGVRCPYCAGNAKLTIKFIRAEFTKKNYTLLTTEYKNAFQKLDYICPNGHKHNIAWNSWQQGHRCPECVGKTSKGEIQVRGFIKSLDIKVSPNDRSQIFNPETGNGLELDIFMPIFNKAIEYNGEYWHQDKDRDLFKQQLCKSKGIGLLTIWDKKWSSNSKECKEIIMKFMFNE